MWNFNTQIFVIILIISTCSCQFERRVRIRSGAGVRGRRDGEVNGGYGLRQSPTILPALYSAPKIQTLEASSPEPEKSVTEGESLDQVGTTTETVDESLIVAKADDQDISEDFTSDSSTQTPDSTESGLSGENDITIEGTAASREGTTQAQTDDVDNDDEQEVPSGRYLGPSNLKVKSNGGDGTTLTTASSPGDDSSLNDNLISPINSYYQSNLPSMSSSQDSSAAYSSYYSPSPSPSQARRPSDQQQVENNFNYQQFPQNPSTSSSSSEQRNGGYGGQRNQQEPNYEQIIALEKSYYSTVPVLNNNGAQGGYNTNTNQNNQQRQFQGGYQQQYQQPQHHYQQQQQQQQPQVNHRYIAQQPEQFYPTPALPQEQQYTGQQQPINPTVIGREDNSIAQSNPNSNNGGYSNGHNNVPSRLSFSTTSANNQHLNPQPQNNVYDRSQVAISRTSEPQQHQREENNGNNGNNGLVINSRADFPNKENIDVAEGLAPTLNNNNNNIIDDSMEFSFEGLNDNVVDADLLERVQQIIEEHERQQKEFLQRQRESSKENNEISTSNNDQQQHPANVYTSFPTSSGRIGEEGPPGTEDLVLDSPKPSMYYQINNDENTQSHDLVRNSQSNDAANNNGEETSRGFNGNSRAQTSGGYSNNNELFQPQIPSTLLRFSQQIQRYPPPFIAQRQSNGVQSQQEQHKQQVESTVPQERRQDSTGSQTIKKFANIDIQPAILTQQFVESGTPSNLQRQSMPVDDKPQESSIRYLPPNQQQQYSPRNNEINPQFRQNGVNPQYEQQDVAQEQVEILARSNGYRQQQQLVNRQSAQSGQEQSALPVVYYNNSPQQLQSAQNPIPNSMVNGGYTRQSSIPQDQITNSNGAAANNGYDQQEASTRSRNGNGRFIQQFRQEYSRPQEQQQQQQQPYPEVQPNSSPSQAYQNYQYSGNPNPIESNDISGYDEPTQPPARNIITKTIVIHEQPALAYGAQYPAELTNRAIITADDLRGEMEISGQPNIIIRQGQDNEQQQYVMSEPVRIGGSEQQQQHGQVQYIPQYQYLTAMSQFTVQDESAQQPQHPQQNIMYFPIVQQQQQQEYQTPQNYPQNRIQPVIETPKPIYGIPLAPVLGPESFIASSNPAVDYNANSQSQSQPQSQQYPGHFVNSNSNNNNIRLSYLPPPQQRQPQYLNSIEASSNQLESAESPAQTVWPTNLNAIYRLPQQGTDNSIGDKGEGGYVTAARVQVQGEGNSVNNEPQEQVIKNPIQLVSRIVSLPQTTTSQSASPSPSSTQSEEDDVISSSYGARIDSRRSIRKRFSQAVASPLAGFFSVKSKKST